MEGGARAAPLVAPASPLLSSLLSQAPVQAAGLAVQHFCAHLRAKSPAQAKRSMRPLLLLPSVLSSLLSQASLQAAGLAVQHLRAKSAAQAKRCRKCDWCPSSSLTSRPPWQHRACSSADVGQVLARR